MLLEAFIIVLLSLVVVRNLVCLSSLPLFTLQLVTGGDRLGEWGGDLGLEGPTLILYFALSFYIVSITTKL